MIIHPRVHWWTQSLRISQIHTIWVNILPLFDRFIKLGGSIWAITVLDEQSIPLRCSGHPTSLYFEKKFPHKIGPWKFRANGHFGPNGALLGPPGAQERPDTRSKCVVTMCPAKAGQSGAVGTKSGPSGPSEDLRSPQKEHLGPKQSDTRSKCVVSRRVNWGQLGPNLVPRCHFDVTACAESTTAGPNQSKPLPPHDMFFTFYFWQLNLMIELYLIKWIYEIRSDYIGLATIGKQALVVKTF